MTTTITELLDRFESVVRTHERLGGGDPEEYAAKEQEYRLARRQLEASILFIRGQAIRAVAESEVGLFGDYALEWPDRAEAERRNFAGGGAR